MASADVSGVSLPLPIFQTGKSTPSPQEGSRSAVPKSGVALTKESTPLPVAVDTVSISVRTRQTIINANKEEVKKAEVINTGNSEKSDKAVARVEFVYDPKGDLIVKYMDSSSRLIYQAPSELMLSIREAALKAESVDTKA